MKIADSMSGNNSVLDSVMASREAATGNSYAERAMNGRRTATNFEQTQRGKSSVAEMQVHVREDAANLDEETAKALEKKQELEKAEAARIAKKQAESAQNTPSQGDTVEISPEGMEAAKDVTVAVSPPTQVAPPASSAPVTSTPPPTSTQTPAPKA